jgi:hypothetical protein
MNGQRIRRMSFWVTITLFLLACGLPFAATPAAPTQIPVGTIIIQTADAAQTQTAIYLPTVTLTPTPTPTFTPTKTPTSTPTLIPPIVLPFLFTATPTVDLSATPEGTASADGTDGGEGGEGEEKDDDDDDDEGNRKANKSDYSSVIDKEWACIVLEKYPKNGTIIGKGVRFSAIWIIYNKGLKVWPEKGVDFLFRAGVRPPGKVLFDLPATVITGGQITLDVTITAPEIPGSYRSIWTLKVGRTYFCKMGINFVVQ